MPNVKQEECETCCFYPEHCHYHNNEGANLTSLIANPDGTCQKRQPKVEPMGQGEISS